MTYDYLTSQKPAEGIRAGHLLHCHRRQPRPGRRLGGQQARAEGCGPYAARAAPKPASTTSPREGAQVTIEEVNYDDCVRMAAAEAAADPARRRRAGHRVGGLRGDSGLDHAGLRHDGHRRRPSSSARRASTVRPTSSSRPASVRWRARVQGYFANLFPENPPDNRWSWRRRPLTACIRARSRRTASRASWAAIYRRSWRGSPAASRTPSPGRSCATTSGFFVSCPDWVARQGHADARRTLQGRSAGHLRRERARSAWGWLAALMEDNTYRELREAHRSSGRTRKVLMFSTEGDTDPRSAA